MTSELLPTIETTTCAACGRSPVERRTTFLCCNQERFICRRCWDKGQNDEAWDDDISNRIQLRDRAAQRRGVRR